MHNDSLFLSKNSFHVLYTSDVEKSHSFYKQLGLQIMQYEEDKVVVQFGTFELHFILDSTEPNESYRHIAVPVKYGQGIIFYVETPNLLEAKQVIQQAGGNIRSDIFENHWNCLEMLFEDVNGYKFALYQEK